MNAESIRPHSRKDRWRHLEPVQVIPLIADDMDRHENTLTVMDRKLDKILWLLVGGMFSLTTGAILLAINLVVIS